MPSALDETFTAIDRVLANPSRAASLESVDEVPTGEDGPAESELSARRSRVSCAALMKNFLAEVSERQRRQRGGVEFACELVRACGLSSIKRLRPVVLDRQHRGAEPDVYHHRGDSVRRLDDELLAVFGEDYIRNTESIGTVSRRGTSSVGGSTDFAGR